MTIKNTASYDMMQRSVLKSTEVSEEDTASIFRLKEQDVQENGRNQPLAIEHLIQAEKEEVIGLFPLALPEPRSKRR
jgi:hypothetical protein